MSEITQSNDIVAPRRGAVIALTSDATARPYDLSLITLGGSAFRTGQNDQIFVTLLASTAVIYHQFSPTTQNDLSSVAAISAGGALAYANTYGPPLPSLLPVAYRLCRVTDRWLILQGVGIVYIWASSPPNASAR